MKRFVLVATAVTLLFFASLESEARNLKKDTHTPKVAHSTDGSALELSPELKELLIREMRALSGGISELTPALTEGDWQRVITIAKKIEGSYIMKQTLTPEQKKELHANLPPVFIDYDKAFHGYAGMLAHAAEKKNADIANFYLSKMTETCIKCHTRFAGERFPGFVKAKKSHDH